MQQPYFNENASVVYTDDRGRKTDTFVVFATDSVTGLTHINHENLRVPADRLTLHAKTVGNYHMPLNDSFSFELLSKLKEKYRSTEAEHKTRQLNPTGAFRSNHQLAKAS
jgi:hypothetical protein